MRGEKRRLQESHQGVGPVHGEGGWKPREPIERGQGWYRVVVQIHRGPGVKQSGEASPAVLRCMLSGSLIKGACPGGFNPMSANSGPACSATVV